ncbi:MAG: DinB family protein [bacterium]|jgi:uncharacterized damage-inducible protein DinB
MFRKIEDFAGTWAFESGTTSKLFENLTDDKLGVPIADGFMTLGDLAYHLAMVIPVIGAQTGLDFPDAPTTDQPPTPTSAQEIRDAYNRYAADFAEQVKAKWTDADLDKTDKVFGYDWKKGFTLDILISHQAHHRGQMTVLMRQAGIPICGIYGPTKEEMAQYGAGAH